MPFVALPLGSEEVTKLADLIPCTGYPTPGVLNGKTGAVISADVFGKVNEGSLDEWIAQL